VNEADIKYVKPTRKPSDDGAYTGGGGGGSVGGGC
jgi:hypothetical protein